MHLLDQIISNSYQSIKPGLENYGRARLTPNPELTRWFLTFMQQNELDALWRDYSSQDRQKILLVMRYASLPWPNFKANWHRWALYKKTALPMSTVEAMLYLDLLASQVFDQLKLYSGKIDQNLSQQALTTLMCSNDWDDRHWVVNWLCQRTEIDIQALPFPISFLDRFSRKKRHIIRSFHRLADHKERYS